ncbi:hypothetical protein C6P42_002160 [Pichia californica]|nr:hypothetical protein C6P42_002160 [[Candida] californica]
MNTSEAVRHPTEQFGINSNKMSSQSQFATLDFDEAEEITFYNIFGEHSYRNCNFWDILSYIIMLIGLILQLLFLGSDIYTLIQIYALKNWDTSHTITYIPILAYKIIFTTCIGISFLYVFFFWILGIFIVKKEKVVGTYLHAGARTIDSLKSYERFCIFEKIQTKNFHDWMCLTIYTSYHYDILSWIFADTPRQILNGATIAYVVSNKFTSGDISGVISSIAQENKKEAVLLSFMFFSFIVWLCFTFKNVIVILSSICVISITKKKNGMKFNKYCANLVAQSVSDLYSEKAQIQEQDFSKRRKIPSFLKDNDAILDIENERRMNESVLNFNINNNSINNNNNNNSDNFYNYSFQNNSTDANDSMDKSNPFSIQLHEIPVSHSRTNLVNSHSTSDIHDNNFVPISEFSDNDDNDDDDDDDNGADPFNLSTADLSDINYEYEDDYQNGSDNDHTQSNQSNQLYGSRGLFSEQRRVL